MKTKWIISMLSVLMQCIAFTVHADQIKISDKEEVSLTVYNQDFALVKEKRKITLEEGINHVILEDVASQIDPTSVHLKSITAPNAVRILEQSYEFDLVNYGKLLQKYIGKEIEIHTIIDNKTGEARITKARLLSSGYSPQPQNSGYGLRQNYNYTSYGQPLFEINGKIYNSAPGIVVLPSLESATILKPALNWQIESKKAGNHTTELSYMTSGINWIADYVALTNPDDTKIDLTGWVTLDNRSGAAYENAALKLMAGDVHLAQPQSLGFAKMDALKSRAEAVAFQFHEKTFFEYHLYTLQRPATIKDNEIKQIEFTSASNIPVTKTYLYDGFEKPNRYQGYNVESYRTIADYMSSSNKKVAVILEFKNSQENRLGIPLPKGRIRLYKKDTDGSQEFIGEDTIDHTPKDETIKLYAGNAFDIVGERKQTDFKVISPSHAVAETFEITLRNHKKEAATVTIVEHLLRWNEWDLANSTHPWEKKDAQTMELKIPVPANGEIKTAYTVIYKW